MQEQPLPVAALHYPATRRNREPIRDALANVLPPKGLVLEIASGSGEHAAFFAPAFPGVIWQPSDREPSLLASIRAHAAAAAAANIRPPVLLDIDRSPWPVTAADAVIAINMLHVAPSTAGAALFAGAAAILPPRAPVFLYGPFKRAGRHTAPSNDAFDRSLRTQDARWGVRDLDDVAAVAAGHGFVLDHVIDMPANNLGIVFRMRT